MTVRTLNTRGPTEHHLRWTSSLKGTQWRSGDVHLHAEEHLVRLAEDSGALDSSRFCCASSSWTSPSSSSSSRCSSSPPTDAPASSPASTGSRASKHRGWCTFRLRGSPDVLTWNNSLKLTDVFCFCFLAQAASLYSVSTPLELKA